MTNKEAIIILKALWAYKEPHYTEKEIREALDLAIKALEEAQLDIKLLKMDLPELFRPSCDGGYLKEGEEE